MPDRRFENLREALLEAGLAPRHVRRAILEIEDHFHRLVDEGLARGESEGDAQIAARDLLGTDQSLIRRYAGLPELRAWAFAVLAYRRRVAPQWPVAGIIILCGLASLINVNVVLTGGAAPGQAGAGIGISADSLPGQTAHAAVTAALILAPLWLALRRLRRDEAAVAD